MKRSPMVRTAFAKKPAAEPKVRLRRCAVKSCRLPFAPRSMTHKCCSPACAETLVISDKVRKLRIERQEGLAKLKTRADYFKGAQAALNAWIRLVRDKDKPCISCGRHHQGQFHAGHFLSRGAHPNLALVENNLAKQCQPCNVHLSGNALNYRRGLIERIGLEAVEALESDDTPRKYSIEDLKAITAHYRKELKGASA
jgi:Bacteriophage Lambda NinG protein.